MNQPHCLDEAHQRTRRSKAGGAAGYELEDPELSGKKIGDLLRQVRHSVNIPLHIFQDPAFWQALGKAQEWLNVYCRACKTWVVPFGECECDEGEATPQPQEAWDFYSDEWFKAQKQSRLSNWNLSAFWQSLP